MSDSDIPCLAPGTVLTGRQRYVIERTLGAGGFGITYLAVTSFLMGNIRVEARVAIKEHFMADYNERDKATMCVTTPGTARSRKMVADSLRDFLGEARRLQTICGGHQSIVKVNEVFEANGTAYYVMEFLDGKTLWSMIEKRGIGEADMLSIMRPIVDAVAYLHRNRLTHLDIKPENIMLTHENGSLRPVLIDFGLSKHYDEKGNATSTVNTFAASSGYAPIEQYAGITTFTPSADVYALGATMLACLTGKIPQKSSDWLVSARMRYIDTLPISRGLKEVFRGTFKDEGRIGDANILLTFPPLSDAAHGSSESERSVRDRLERERREQAKAARREQERREQAEAARREQERREREQREKIEKIRREQAEALERDRQRREKIEQIKREQAEAIRFQSQKLNGLNANPKVWESHSQPSNLFLAVERKGVQYYFSLRDWMSLPTVQQYECRKLGIVIDKDGQQFILSLVEEKGTYKWDDAISYFGEGLPSKAQAQAWISQLSEVYYAIKSFGGYMPDAANGYDPMTSGSEFLYWTKTEYDASFAWYISVFNGVIGMNGKNKAYKVRKVSPLIYNKRNENEHPLSDASHSNSAHDSVPRATAAEANNDPSENLNLNLAAEQNGEKCYFSRRQWMSLTSSQQNKYKKIGIVIEKDGQRFILSLTDEKGLYSWNEAVKRYGAGMPTKAQAEAWISQKDEVQRAIVAFGGDVPDIENKYDPAVDGPKFLYWTKTEYDASFAWYISTFNGLISMNGKNKTYKVRLIRIFC